MKKIKGKYRKGDGPNTKITKFIPYHSLLISKHPKKSTNFSVVTNLFLFKKKIKISQNFILFQDTHHTLTSTTNKMISLCKKMIPFYYTHTLA